MIFKGKGTINYISFNMEFTQYYEFDTFFYK